MNSLKFYALALAFFLAPQAFTQSKEQPPGPKAQKTIQSQPVKPAEIKRQALDAIDREIARAASYENLRDRISIWTTAADIIWDEDPLKARTLLRDSYALTMQATAEKAPGEKKFMVALKNDGLRRKLKTDILLVAQKHDLKLIKELLDSAEPEDTKELEELHNSPLTFGTASFSKRQLASFAALLAKTEPKKAVEYALASMGYGVPQEFNDIFRSLLASDPASAKKLFSLATDQYIRENSLNLYDGLILAGYLNLEPVNGQDEDTARRLLDAALSREQRVWSMYSQKVLTDEMVPGVVISTSQTLYRLFRAHNSDQAGNVESFIRQVSPAISDRQEFSDETVSDSIAAGDPEALLEKAEKEVNEDNKNALYLEAALAYAGKKRFEKALSAASQAKNEIKRGPVEDYIRSKQVQYLVNKGELYDAMPVIERITDPESRAEVTIEFAKKAQKTTQKPLALQVLNDTQKVYEKSFNSTPNARAYIWLGSAYTALDYAAGYDIMDSAIKRVNQTRDFTELNSTVKLVHLGGKSNVALTVGNSKGDFRSGFRTLARKNFDQTLLLAENFENKFFRGTAVITSAAAVLDDERLKQTAVKQSSSKN
jgi:tetratricopeptide (TPR) repeat protein